MSGEGDDLLRMAFAGQPACSWICLWRVPQIGIHKKWSQNVRVR
ncbi:unnamed protein product [Ectocarpus sp. 12 AP-2014]